MKINSTWTEVKLFLKFTIENASAITKSSGRRWRLRNDTFSANGKSSTAGDGSCNWQDAAFIAIFPFVALRDKSSFASPQHLFLLLLVAGGFRQSYINSWAVQIAAVKRLHRSDGIISLLKVYKSVILDFLDSLQWPVSFKTLQEPCLGKFVRKITNVQHLHLKVQKQYICINLMKSCIYNSNSFKPLP